MKKKVYSAARLLQLQKVGFQIQAEKQRKQISNRKMFNQIKHEQRSFSRKRILSHIQPRKNVGNFLQPTKIISVSAHKWVIYDYYTTKYIRGYRAHNKAELGVFSKLLVFCTINTLIKKHKLDPRKFQTIVTPSVLKMFPKQKLLHIDDIISLEDLLHLMILDQSEIFQVILSANVGAYLYKKHKNEYYSVYDVNQKTLKNHLKYFYQLVNSYCKLMHLENIQYLESDPTLRKQTNYCSAADVARLSIQCLNIPLFVQILNKKQHSVEIKYVDKNGHLANKNFLILNQSIEQKFIPYISVCRNWQQKQFMSSHCSIQYQDEKAAARPIMVVLFGCYSPKDRERDIQQIVQWYLKSQNLLNCQKNAESLHKKILKTEPNEKLDDVLQRKIEQKLSLNKNAKINISFFNNAKVNSKINQKLKTDNQKNQDSETKIIVESGVKASQNCDIKGLQNKAKQSNKRIRKLINIKTQQSQ